jgi:hypothetical protein
MSIAPKADRDGDSIPIFSEHLGFPSVAQAIAMTIQTFNGRKES